jgi:hypothetical protein
MSALANKRNKDSANAHRMKLEGVERKSCNCPMCHRRVMLTGLYSHLFRCN